MDRDCWGRVADYIPDGFTALSLSKTCKGLTWLFDEWYSRREHDELFIVIDDPKTRCYHGRIRYYDRGAAVDCICFRGEYIEDLMRLRSGEIRLKIDNEKYSGSLTVRGLLLSEIRSGNCSGMYKIRERLYNISMVDWKITRVPMGGEIPEESVEAILTMLSESKLLK